MNRTRGKDVIKGIDQGTGRERDPSLPRSYVRLEKESNLRVAGRVRIGAREAHRAPVEAIRLDRILFAQVERIHLYVLGGRAASRSLQLVLQEIRVANALRRFEACVPIRIRRGALEREPPRDRRVFVEHVKDLHSEIGGLVTGQGPRDVD